MNEVEKFVKSLEKLNNDEQMMLYIGKGENRQFDGGNNCLCNGNNCSCNGNNCSCNLDPDLNYNPWLCTD